jgi:phosphoglycolate phosphatase
MNVIKGYIFDLDGTLLDTLDDLTFATNHVLLQYGYAQKTREEVRYLVGEGIKRLLEKATGHRAQSGQMEEMVGVFMEYYGSHLIVNTRAYAGIHQMLETLVSLNIPLAVFSNKSHEFTVQLIRHFFQDIPFCMIEGKRENVPAKPDPTGALCIIEAMKLPAAEVAFVGDTRTDMETSVNSGTFPIGVTWGFRPEAELLEYGAKMILNKPDELAVVFASGDV